MKYIPKEPKGLFETLVNPVEDCQFIFAHTPCRDELYSQEATASLITKSHD